MQVRVQVRPRARESNGKIGILNGLLSQKIMKK